LFYHFQPALRQAFLRQVSDLPCSDPLSLLMIAFLLFAVSTVSNFQIQYLNITIFNVQLIIDVVCC
jgi:hypothetical protein